AALRALMRSSRTSLVDSTALLAAERERAGSDRLTLSAWRVGAEGVGMAPLVRSAVAAIAARKRSLLLTSEIGISGASVRPEYVPSDRWKQAGWLTVALRLARPAVPASVRAQARCFRGCWRS